MTRLVTDKGERFQNSVGIKFQLYNSLFLSLPFYGVDKTGILLSLFNSRCEEALAERINPIELIDTFFADRPENEKTDLLFRFVQYAERQVVLFDALEDAAFEELHDMDGAGTLAQLKNASTQADRVDALAERLRDFSVRLVLTAHPTQFYPGSVLGIINDLTAAIADNNVSEINTLLQQLGRTPFFKKKKPTPFDEALSLIWYLESVFYDAIGHIAADIQAIDPESGPMLNEVLRMGFWSGGDRDGNPFVTSNITLDVANALRHSILRCYYADVRKLKRRLTFANVEGSVSDLEKRLYRDAFENSEPTLTAADIRSHLVELKNSLETGHNGLFTHLIDDLINKVDIFGLYFAALDIRQEAAEHEKALTEINLSSTIFSADYTTLSNSEKIAQLLAISQPVTIETVNDQLTRDTLETIAAVKRIQLENGPEGCERYVISQCQTSAHVVEVLALFVLGGWPKDAVDMDIIPLFETITDLKNASQIMRELYELPAYRDHLSRRKNKQTIMLGFSDGTKDGGYLMANWSIFKAKEELTALAREFGITVIFFDGRGGPPARGGGKTQRFYSSMGNDISGDAIQITVQGQTVSSNFGTAAAARYNIEQLLHAGIHSDILMPKAPTFTENEARLMEELAEHSFKAYDELKGHPDFLDYLAAVSPLLFYAEANIGSRPAQRGRGKLTLDSLRAIPFVGSWSQIKQNVPGFYGLGSALQKMAAEISAVAKMYHANGFFKALIDNAEMSMQKSNFAISAFLADDPKFGAIWKKIFDEFELTQNILKLISGSGELMSDLPVDQLSVRTRERIVLPLVTIQQYALSKIRELERDIENDPSQTDGHLIGERQIYEKLVIRCSFGIINAGRNSA